MKHNKSFIHSKAHKVLTPYFEDQKLTSFAGMVVFQSLFQKINFKSGLRACFQRNNERQFGFTTILFILIIHLLLGFRRLRDIAYYQDDPIVKRTVGIDIMPDVSTVSRTLAALDANSVVKRQAFSSHLVPNRLSELKLSRVTVDFDGTVQSTTGHAEGSPVGFNKRKKGARSYYPLLCTIAQTSQILDMLHRPGNVHDSKGALEYIKSSILAVKSHCPEAVIESRTDSAFFNERIIDLYNTLAIEFSISVPFSRFSELKEKVEAQQNWHSLTEDRAYFECDWKAKCWEKKQRFIFIKTRVKKQDKKPIQLDLFEPYEYGYEFKVIVTNKKLKAHQVLAFHNGRGVQESIIGDLKSHCQQDYLPVKTLNGNKTYLLAGIIAHNLSRELQIMTGQPLRKTTAKRKPLWQFTKLGTMRRNFIQRAGRLTRPNGKLRLTMSANESTQKDITNFLNALKQVA